MFKNADFMIWHLQTLTGMQAANEAENEYSIFFPLTFDPFQISCLPG